MNLRVWVDGVELDLLDSGRGATCRLCSELGGAVADAFVG